MIRGWDDLFLHSSETLFYTIKDTQTYVVVPDVKPLSLFLGETTNFLWRKKSLFEIYKMSKG